MTGSLSFDVSRRVLLASGLASLAFPALGKDAHLTLRAGTYAADGGMGLYLLTSSGDQWTAGPPNTTIRNASFGATSKRHGLRYLLDETRQGWLRVYDRAFRPLAACRTLGDDPCHVTLSPDETTIAVANYSSGDIAVWGLDPRTGLPLGEAQLVRHKGGGPNAERQAGPHAHWVGFTADARWLHAVDLGADAIFAHAFDARSKSLGDSHIAYRTSAGSGPRHLARHPRLPVAYLVTELANSLIVLDAQQDGTFRERNVSSTLPASFRGESNAAHIAINAVGTRLYISNRGHDSIAVFAVAENGSVELIQHASCGGHWPRFFLLVENRGELLVANQRSGTVVCMPVDQRGMLGAASSTVLVPGVAYVAS
jgi:6-phosphogluconolactonase